MTAYGGPEVMRYQDMPDPTPGAGDVLIKAAGIGINPEDMLERNGILKDQFPLQFPAIIGLDVSGTVVAAGDAVTGLKIGDRVCGWSYHTYAELVADNANLFAKVPETMDLVDAAAIPLVGLTGSQLISVASGLQSGQTVLVSGAAGAVGRCAVYMAKSSGAHVIAGVQRFQLDQAASIGADETIALDDPVAFAKIPQVDVVANVLRGKPATDLLAKVKDGGTFASVTGAPGRRSQLPEGARRPVPLKARPSGHRLHPRCRKRRQGNDPHRPPRAAEERRRGAGRVHERRHRQGAAHPLSKPKRKRNRSKTT